MQTVLWWPRYTLYTHCSTAGRPVTLLLQDSLHPDLSSVNCKISLFTMKVVLCMLVMFARPSKASDDMKEIATYLFGGMGAFFAIVICLGLCCASINNKLDAAPPHQASQYGQN